MIKRPNGGQSVRSKQQKEITRYLNEVPPEAAAWMLKLSSKSRWSSGQTFQKRFFQLKGPFLMYWPNRSKAQQYSSPDAVYDLRCMTECSRGDDDTIKVLLSSQDTECDLVVKSVSEEDDDDLDDWLSEWVSNIQSAAAHYKDEKAEERTPSNNIHPMATPTTPPVPVSTAMPVSPLLSGLSPVHPATLEKLKSEVEDHKKAAAEAKQERMQVQHQMEQMMDREMKKLKQQHQEEVAQLKEERRSIELNASQDAKQSQDQALSDQANEHRQAMAQLEAEHEKALEAVTQLKAEHEKALQETIESQNNLGRNETENLLSNESITIEAQEEVTRQVQEELAAQAGEHREIIERLEAEHERTVRDTIEKQ